MEGFYISHPRETGIRKISTGQYRFRVWAPYASQVSLTIVAPSEQKISMKPEDFGYWFVDVASIEEGALYYYLIDGEKLSPDPASLSQPQGVHGPSEVLDVKDFFWTDHDWEGIDQADMIIYELHTGTFTEKGTFEGIIDKLDYLIELGITAIEIMPVSQFPGTRNWGYDGVYPFAVQDSYGGARAFQKMINEAHNKGLAVILDVVYNHLGPEGNYLFDFGPYFTDKYHTPWGQAVNFDDAGCDGVRNYFIQNMLMWFRDFHIDVLRLDAVHAIWDFSSTHIMKEMMDVTEALNKDSTFPHYLIAECDLNDVKYINSRDIGGFELSGQWADDFHHAVHACLTGESRGYYKDFGYVGDVKKALHQPFVYDGIYSIYRQKTYGSIPKNNPNSQFVVCIQNHDQVGNRMKGDRFGELLSFDQLKLAAATLFLSPYIPLLFMGEEYGETAPFQYFISHTDEELTQLVREGRAKEFESFREEGQVPDPADKNTFLRSRLSFDMDRYQERKVLFQWYKSWLSLRKEHPVLRHTDRSQINVQKGNSSSVIVLKRKHNEKEVVALLNYGKDDQEIELADIISVRMQKMIDSSEKEWGGSGTVAPALLPDNKKVKVNSYGVVVYESFNI